MLGDGDLAALAIVRSLGRYGLDVHLAAFERSPVTRRSRYVARVHELGHPLEDGPAFFDRLLALLRDVDFDLVIPTSDKALVPLIERREHVERLARVAAPGARGFDVTNRKDETIALARACGLRVPSTTRIASAEDLGQLDVGMPYPVVLKPVSSMLPGRPARNRVRYARCRDELEQRLPGMLVTCPVLVQELCPGRGMGLSVLARDGIVSAAFQHERVHEPPEGGAGSYRRSAPLDPGLLEGVRRFCRAIDWTGPAMFEFKRVTDGPPVLMEVNGRFWGSLALAISAGVDFPRLLYESIVLGTTTEVFDYRVPHYVRHTLSDVPWWWANLRVPPGRAELLRVPASQWLVEPINVIRGRERFDLESLSDPLPALAGWRDFANTAARAIRRRVERRLAVRRVERATDALRRSPTALARRVATAHSVLFVCQGNINRSAVAARMLERLRDHDQAGAALRIASAGFELLEGRPSPAVSRAVAAEMGLDLSAHRSSTVTAAMLDGFDLIVPMEPVHSARIAELRPAAAEKCVLLSAFDPEECTCGIPDPDGGSRDVFADVYARVVRCVRSLAQCRAVASGAEMGSHHEAGRSRDHEL